MRVGSPPEAYENGHAYHFLTDQDDQGGSEDQKGGSNKANESANDFGEEIDDRTNVSEDNIRSHKK